MPFIDFRFYLVTDRTQCVPRTLASVVHDAFTSGVRAVQLREKDFTASDIVALATRVVDIARPKNARVFVNVSDSVDDDTARLLVGSPGIDGLHVPDDPALLDHIRAVFPKLLVGASTHSRDGVRAAADAGADFVTFGPVFAAQKKQQQGLEKLAEACALAPIPVFAIGGVTPQNAVACREAGAYGVAAIRAVMAASSARRAVREFAEAMGEL